MSPTLNPVDLVTRVTRDVERSALRARNGVRYVRGSYRGKTGATPKDVVWERDKAQLWHYRNGPVRYGPPVLFVHSLVSRSYILDLRPGSSLIEYLTGAGIDVFLLDWGVPDELDAENDLERYVDGYLPRAIAAVQRETGSAEVTLAGYCLGGVLSAIYAAAHEDAPVRNLILMATPLDFDEMGAMVALLRDGRLNPEELVDGTGNVPADALYSGFYMQAPTSEVAQKATLLENLWNDEFVEGFQAMAEWARDHVPFPGAMFGQLVEEFVRKNVLMTGSIRVAGREVQLANARGTVLNAMAEGRQRRPAPGRRADHADRGRPRAARGAAAARRPRHVRHRPQRAQAHDAAPRGVDHRALRRTPRTRGAVMEFRPIEPGDEPALTRFFARIPDSDRTFLKEDIDDPEVVAAWARPGAARVIAVDDGEVVGSVAIVPLHGWSSHVGEVRLVVDPEHRGRGIGRGLARQAVVEALNLGLAKLMVEVISDQTALIGMFRALGFEPEALLADHVRDRSGEVRDLMVLANNVESQFSSMAVAGITDQL